MAFFKNEDTKMQQINNEKPEININKDEDRLVTLMTTAIREYYHSKNLSEEEVKLALKENIDEIHRFIGRILASITIQDTKKQSERLDNADNGYGFY